MRYIIIPVAILSILLVYGRGRREGTEEGARAIRPDVTTVAVTLYRDYQEDPAGADQMYIGKVLEVSGRVLRVEQDMSGQVAVILQGSESGLAGVECLVSTAQLSHVTKLRGGQLVTVKGQGAGKIVHVRLKECALVNAAPVEAENHSALGGDEQLQADMEL